MARKKGTKTRGINYAPLNGQHGHAATPGHLVEAGPAAEVVGPPYDPFDPARLGLPQDFAAAAMVKKQFDTIKVEKPSYSRVFHAHPEWGLRALLLTLKEDRETYLVQPGLRASLSRMALCAVHELFPCVTKQGTPFIWPVKMAAPDGKWNIWHRTAHEIAQNAKERWTRMEANSDAGYYIATYDQRPLGQQTVPDWPEMEFNEWLRLAFQHYTIDKLDHPVLKRLRLED